MSLGGRPGEGCYCSQAHPPVRVAHPEARRASPGVDQRLAGDHRAHHDDVAEAAAQPIERTLAEAKLQPGQEIGPYRILDELDRSAMTDVASTRKRELFAPFAAAALALLTLAGLLISP